MADHSRIANQLARAERAACLPCTYDWGSGSRPRRLTLAGGVGDEFGHFFGLLLVEDAGGHAAGSGAVDAVFDRVEDAAFGRFDRLLCGAPARRAGRRQQDIEVPVSYTHLRAHETRHDL